MKTSQALLTTTCVFLILLTLGMNIFISQTCTPPSHKRENLIVQQPPKVIEQVHDIREEMPQDEVCEVKLPPNFLNLSHTLSYFDKEMVAKNAHLFLWQKLYEQQYPDPSECSNRRIVICKMSIAQTCGFGCQLHHFAYCMIYGLATQRTVVFDENNGWNKREWKYALECKESRWECYFEQVSTCRDYAASYNGKVEYFHKTNAHIVELQFRQSREYTAWIPPDILPLIQLFHSRPRVWFVGQIVQWLLRPNEQLRRDYEEMRASVFQNFRSPILGLHVRGDDKSVEAAIRPLSEYMQHAPKHFKTIFLATDDKRNVKATEDYPDITWLMVKQKDRVSGVGSRHQAGALRNLIFDILYIKCDHLIGTDSSQISRAAYELMQTHHLDASDRGWSLETIVKDHQYFFYWFLI